MDYSGKQVLVLGLGESGLAMANWLQRCGAHLLVADTRAAPARLPGLQSACPDARFVATADGLTVFSASLLAGVDFVALSPGLMPDGELAEILPAAAAAGIAVWGEIELFAQALAHLRDTRAYAPKLIAITGTNGKTTVTSLTGKLVARAGLSVQVAGNISPAALDMLRERLDQDNLPQVWVLELSSFQLFATHSLQADAACVLNVTQDHLDWHGSMAAYAAAKARIFAPLSTRVLNRQDPMVMAMALPPPAPPAKTARVAKGAKAASALLAASAAAIAADSLHAPDTPDTPDATGFDASGTEGGAPAPAPAPEPIALLPVPTMPTEPQQITFAADEPRLPGDFGLSNERGVQWLVQAVAQEDGEKKRRRKGEIIDIPVSINRLMPVDALKIRGQHNATNVLAALALCRAIGLPLAPLLHGVREYQGEPHRVEWLQSIGGVDYFDDSKGTNVGATVAAIIGLGVGLSAAGAKLVLIAGGDGKGQDFSPLQEPVCRHVRAVCLIGKDGARIGAALADSGVPCITCATLDEATSAAARAAQSGDAVLLSPACASMDMFTNYAHRAEVFVAAVREVALQSGELA